MLVQSQIILTDNTVKTLALWEKMGINETVESSSEKPLTGGLSFSYIPDSAKFIRWVQDVRETEILKVLSSTRRI